MLWIVILIFILIFLILFLNQRDDSTPLTFNLGDSPSPSPQLVLEIKERLKIQLDNHLKFGPYSGIRFSDILYAQLDPVAECMARVISQGNLTACQTQGLEWQCGFGQVLCNAKKLGRYLSQYGMAPEESDECQEPCKKEKKCCLFRKLGRVCTDC